MFVASCNGELKSGKYIYSSLVQRSEITINNNGSFHQVIVSLADGQRIESKGVWKKKNSTILFSPFLKSVAEKKDSILIPAKEYSSFPGVLKGNVIIFDERSEYWFQ
jgi:hypothetical protein